MPPITDTMKKCDVVDEESELTDDEPDPMQLGCPVDGCDSPEGHVRQLVCPVYGCDVPAGQSEQSELPSKAEKRPAAHSRQSLELSCFEAEVLLRGR